jgi:hypothetical protein
LDSKCPLTTKDLISDDTGPFLLWSRLNNFDKLRNLTLVFDLGIDDVKCKTRELVKEKEDGTI